MMKIKRSVMIKGGKEIKINEDESYIEISSDDLKDFLISQAFRGDEEGNQFDEEGNEIDFDDMEEM